MLVHDFGSDRRAWLPLIEPLRHIGAAVLAPYVRGHGESATEDTRERPQRADPGLYREMQSDLRGAYDWLASQGNVDRARFSIIAAGSGAAVALQYAAKDRSVDVVVCLTPPWDQLTFDPVADMRQVRGRNILLVAGPAGEETCKSLAGHTKGAEVRTSQAPGRGCELLAADPQLCSSIAKFAQDRMGSRSKAVVCGSIESHIYHALDSAWVAKINPTNLRTIPRRMKLRHAPAPRRSMAPDDAVAASPTPQAVALNCRRRSAEGGKLSLLTGPPIGLEVSSCRRWRRTVRAQRLAQVSRLGGSFLRLCSGWRFGLDERGNQ